MGLGSYRFSIEWARIEPTAGHYDIRQLDHYRDMLRVCRRHGLHTVVTLHHFTSPAWLAAPGGFEDPATMAAFTAYAEAVVRHCGDLIDTLCTFNEANLSFSDFIPATALAPILDAAKHASGSPAYRSYLFDDASKSKPIVRACHLAARRATKAIRPNLPVGLTLAMSGIQDAPGAPGAAIAERSKRYDVWLEIARGDDFVGGGQDYTRKRFDTKGSIPPPAGTVRTQLDQQYYPARLAGAVRYAASVARTPILVTERHRHTKRRLARWGVAALPDGIAKCQKSGVLGH